MTLEELLNKEAEPGDFLHIQHGNIVDSLPVKSTFSLMSNTLVSYLLGKEVKNYKVKRDSSTFAKTIIVKLQRER